MTEKRPYDKPATTYAQQIATLCSRGMLIPDEDTAKFYLQHIGYYRLSGYWLVFESNHETHQFVDDTCFTDVLDLYKFDRELRLHILDAIERIEVSARAQWAYRLGHLHGAHAHLNQSLVRNKSVWAKNCDDLRKEVERADEAFVRHLLSKYSEALPPVWAVCEVMSLGALSRWYSNLKPMHTKSLIANIYGLDEAVFRSWLHHLSVVRNVCAHHSRLWNREFNRVAPQFPRSKPARLAGEFCKEHKLYNTLIILLHFMDHIAPQHRWRTRLKTQLHEYEKYLVVMGFPCNWKDRAIWHDLHDL